MTSRTHNTNAQTFPNNLPPELLAETFTWACDHQKTTSLILGHVCAAWRAIVWSTPELWSHISLRLVSPELHPLKYAHQIADFEDHLSRSGGCPLTLVLAVEREREWVGTNPIPVEFVRLLADSLSRWQSVKLKALPTMAWHPFLEEAVRSLLPGGFPCLHTLRIWPPSCEDLDNTDTDSEDDFDYSITGLWSNSPYSSGEEDDEVYMGPKSGTPWHLDLFSVAPALRTVALRSCRVADVELPWCQLTSLTLHGIRRHECPYVLHKTTNLTYLNIVCFACHSSGTQRLSGRCLLPALEQLVMGCHTANFLDYLSTPALHSLDIMAGNITWDPLTLPRLLDGLGCHLTRLKLRQVHIPSKMPPGVNIVHLVREVSSLEVLEVKMQRRYPRLEMESTADSAHHATDADLLVKLLGSCPGMDAHFLPNLTHFSYSGPLKATSSRFHDTIFQQLRFRCGSAAAERNLHPLLSFSINTRNGYNPLSAINKALLKGLREGGLRVTLYGVDCDGKMIHQ